VFIAAITTYYISLFMIVSFYNSFCNSSFGLKSRTILVNFINSSFVLKRGVKGIPPASNPRPMINESHTPKEASTNASLINTKVILPTDEIIKPYSSPKYSRTPRTMPRKSTKDDFPSNKGKLEPIVPMQQKLNSWSASTSNPYVKTSNNNPQLNNNNQQAPQTNTNNKPYRSITGRLFDYFRGNKNVTPIVNEPQALPLAPLVIPNVVPQVVVQDVNALIPILPLVNNVLPNVDSPNAPNAPIVIDESLVNNVSSNNSNVSSSSDIPLTSINDSNPIPDASNESISNDVNSIPLGEALQQELIEKSSSIGLKTDNAVSDYDASLNLKTISPVFSDSTSTSNNVIEQGIAYGLLKYQDTTEYPKSGLLTFTPEGYKFLRKAYPLVKNQSSDIASTEGKAFEVGVLKIDANTLIPISSQEHLVIVHDYKNNEICVIGILTSEKGPDLITLSKNQPISDNDKEQNLKLLSVPYKLKPEDFNKHEKATNYIQAPNITKIVNDSIHQIKNEPVPYNSKGSTLENITRIIELKKQESENAKALEASKQTNFMSDEKEVKAALKKKKAALNSEQQKAKAKEEKLQKAKQAQQAIENDNTNENINN
jgi:hypothetical protein